MQTRFDLVEHIRHMAEQKNQTQAQYHERDSSLQPVIAHYPRALHRGRIVKLSHIVFRRFWYLFRISLIVTIAMRIAS